MIKLTRPVIAGTLLEVTGRWVLRPVMPLCCVRSSLDRWDRALSICREGTRGKHLATERWGPASG